VSAPDKDPPPPAISVVELKPELVDDRDQTSLDHEDIYQPMLGPTLDQLQKKKAAEGTLAPGDIAGYLAVEKALAEMREETWLSIPFEAVTLIVEKLVEPAVWGKLEAEKQAEAVRPRDEKLQDRANERYPPEAEATGIAKDFLAEADSDPALWSLLVLKNADGDDKLMEDGETPKLMTLRTLREIIGKRGERPK
jgi:hypothetical protein